MTTEEKKEAIRHKGTVAWFNEKKGWGFIEQPDGQRDVFLHYTCIEPDREGFKTVMAGESVTFEIVKVPLGLKALNVKRGAGD